MASNKYGKYNPFTQSMLKSKEDLAGSVYTMNGNKRVLLRSDSINAKQPGVPVEMAPINLSAGLVDMKLQQKRNNQPQQRRIHA